jgi:hypothetical protein
LSNYLLIASRDPYQYADARSFFEMAADLSKNGNQVTVYLVQNGVLPARKGAANSPVATLRQQAPSVSILADDFSLRERAIPADGLAAGVNVAPIDRLVDLLAQADTKAIWH